MVGGSALRKLESYLLRAGIQNIQPGQFILLLLGGFAIVLTLLAVITNSILISAAVCICVGAQLIESFQSKIATETQKADTQWPKYLDSIHSASWAGASLEQALVDSIASAPAKHSWALLEFEKDQSSGLPFGESLDNLKVRLANPIADRFIEITRLASVSGGRGYLNALRAQSLQLRLENSTWSEIQVKQNWVLGTAKLAVLAPWLILVLLSLRPETAIAFQSESGIAVLAVGLIASLLAYRLIKSLGKLPSRQRILGI
jgi:tight adherence protein B